VLAVLWLGGAWLYGAAIVVLAAGVIEYRRLTGAMNAPAPWWILAPLSFALLLRLVLPSWLNLQLLFAAATVAGLAAMVFLRDWRQSVTRWALAVGGSLYLGYLLSFYLALYFWRQPDPGHLGFKTVIAVFGTVWIGDTAAMLVGTRFGRHRFFPRISPHKTVEGAIAGLVGSGAFFALVGPMVQVFIPHDILLGVLIGAMAQVGDLVESQLKRTAGVKDASQLIPGHGGILDRIDSLLLVGPVVYYYLQVAHLR
jgi:phosphatidate cytidylyltransferase